MVVLTILYVTKADQLARNKLCCLLLQMKILPPKVEDPMLDLQVTPTSLFLISTIVVGAHMTISALT